MEKLTIQVALSQFDGDMAPSMEEEMVGVAAKGLRVQKTYSIQESNPKKIGNAIVPILAEIEKFVTGVAGS